MTEEWTSHRPESVTSPRTYPWSPERLRHAIWLVLPPTRRQGPDLVAAAAAIGVSARSLRRWLSGQSIPTGEHAAALRAVLLPDRTVLAQQQDERRWAEGAVRTISAPRGRGVDPVWRSRGWHKPHVLRVLTSQELGLARAAVALENSAKRFYPPAGWTITSEEVFPNRPAALLAKHGLLDEMAPHRVSVRADLVPTGRHECWLVDAQ